MRLKTETLGACPVCEGTQLNPLLEVPDFESSTGTYGIVECRGCGVAFTNPRPIESELPLLYDARSTADFPQDQGGLVPRLRDAAIDRYLGGRLGSVAPADDRRVDVLDFGCGDGALSRGILRRPSARVTAVDFHDEAPPALRAADPERLRYLDYARWSESSERYDAIFLRHVLEHHPDPLRLLAKLRVALRPGGRLFVEVPNRRSAWARILGACFFPYYVPRHLLHFDRSSLRALVERSGLRCIALTPGHTPVLGRSVAYRTGWNMGNLGVFGLATYPIQVALDLVARSSTTLQVTATPDG